MADPQALNKGKNIVQYIIWYECLKKLYSEYWECNYAFVMVNEMVKDFFMYMW